MRPAHPHVSLYLHVAFYHAGRRVCGEAVDLWNAAASILRGVGMRAASLELGVCMLSLLPRFCYAFHLLSRFCERMTCGIVLVHASEFAFICDVTMIFVQATAFDYVYVRPGGKLQSLRGLDVVGFVVGILLGSVFTSAGSVFTSVGSLFTSVGSVFTSVGSVFTSGPCRVVTPHSVTMRLFVGACWGITSHPLLLTAMFGMDGFGMDGITAELKLNCFTARFQCCVRRAAGC
eukprot:365789-Chlamydomonas_euryale.AAC.2